jgi:hypothetical protein
MSIQYVGHSLIRTPIHPLHVHNILHAPQATKHLLSVHHITRDNNMFFEFHPYHFLVKDTPTMIPLLHDKCIGDMYPMSFHGAPLSSEALLAVRPSADLWHRCLGQPRSFAFDKVFSQNSLLPSPPNKHTSVCNACQMAKSHELPFSDLNTLSSSPLELVHTDV